MKEVGEWGREVCRHCTLIFGILCLPDSHYSNIMIKCTGISFPLFLTRYLRCSKIFFLVNFVKFGRKQFNYTASPHHKTPEAPLYIFHNLKKDKYTC